MLYTSLYALCALYVYKLNHKISLWERICQIWSFSLVTLVVFRGYKRVLGDQCALSPKSAWRDLVPRCLWGPLLLPQNDLARAMRPGMALTSKAGSPATFAKSGTTEATTDKAQKHSMSQLCFCYLAAVWYFQLPRDQIHDTLSQLKGVEVSGLQVWNLRDRCAVFRIKCISPNN